MSARTVRNQAPPAHASHVQADRAARTVRIATLAVSVAGALVCLWIIGRGISSAYLPGPLPPGAGLSLAGIGLALLAIHVLAALWAWRHP